MSELTPEKLDNLRQLLHSGPRDCAIGMLFVDNAEALLDAAAERDALAAKLAAVREWIDRRGVNVDDRDDDYMRGYRDAQRRALLDANGLRAMLDATPETGGES